LEVLEWWKTWNNLEDLEVTWRGGRPGVIWKIWSGERIGVVWMTWN